MNLIKSRLLKRLDAEIAAAPSLVRSAVLKAQRAIVLLRHGQTPLAREALTPLHQLHFQHPHPEIIAWLHLAEGLVSYYTDFSSAARDKILRAQAIAQSAQLRALDALASAWLANLAYVRHDLPELLRQARHCEDHAAPEQHDARCRLAMTLGLAHHFASETEQAQVCYARARRHAAAEGDDASLSALIYNMAEMRTSQARRDALSGLAAAGGPLLAGADSIGHYDQAVGGSAMPGLTPVLRAQILALDGQFTEAQRLYEAHLPETMSQGLARLGSSLLADLAWCRVNTGQAERALQQAREAEVELDPGCDIDDRAATHSRLAQVYQALGDAEASERHGALAVAAWREFGEQQRAWSAALREAGL